MACLAACVISSSRTRVGTQRELLAAGDAVRGKQGFKSHCVAGRSAENTPLAPPQGHQARASETSLSHLKSAILRTALDFEH